MQEVEGRARSMKHKKKRVGSEMNQVEHVVDGWMMWLRMIGALC